MSFSIHKDRDILSSSRFYQKPEIKRIYKIPSDFESIGKALDDIDKSGVTNSLIEISPGIYRENLIIKDNIHIRGMGRSSHNVKIEGSINIVNQNKKSSNFLSSFTIESKNIALIINGKNENHEGGCKVSLSDMAIIGNKCAISADSIDLTLIKTDLDNYDDTVPTLILNNGTCLLSLSSIENNVNKKSIDMNSSTMSISYSEIFGAIRTQKSVFISKFSQLVSKDDTFPLVTTEHIDDVIQLFHSLVYIKGSIKVGPGISTRSGLISLLNQTPINNFIGGSNIELPFV